MAVVLTILIGAIIGALTWWYVNFSKWNKRLSKCPGPTPIPIIGNAHKFGGVTDFLPAAAKFTAEYGEIFKIWLGATPRLIVSDAKFLEFLLSSTVHLEKSYEYEYLQPWLGTGLLTSESAKWKRHRKLITPTFHFQILEQFIDIFDTQSGLLVKKLDGKANETEFDIFPYVTLCALDNICEAAMGTPVNAQSNGDSDYVQSVKGVCRIVMERCYSPIKMWDLLFTLSKDFHLQKKWLNILHTYTRSVIKSRKANLSKDDSKKVSEDADIGIKKRMTFLDLLLQCRMDGQPLPDECIREEVDTFMFEGHDTTASGISFTLYCLAKNPKIQKKVVDELRDIFQEDKDRPSTLNDLQNMKYLDMVIKESMRIYPPVPIIGRKFEQDAEFNGNVIPKGVSVTLFIYGLHRKEDMFPDPEKFDPERFTLENCTNRPPYAYLPFSAGPRNCIGQKFAMLEMKSVVSKVLRNFELIEVPEHRPILAFEAILKSTNGLLIRLKKREW